MTIEEEKKLSRIQTIVKDSGVASLDREEVDFPEHNDLVNIIIRQQEIRESLINLVKEYNKNIDLLPRCLHENPLSIIQPFVI